jgi:hypothetical protein
MFLLRSGRVARWTNTPARIFKDPAPSRPRYIRYIGPPADCSCLHAIATNRTYFQLIRFELTKSAQDMDSAYDDDAGDRFTPPVLVIGDRCVCKPKGTSEESGGNANGQIAKVMFVGTLPPPMPPGYWVGVMFESKVGKNDGTLNGRKYFICPPGHGGFVRPSRVKDINEEKRRQEEAERAAEALRNKKQKLKDKGPKSKDDTSEAGGGSVQGGAGDAVLDADGKKLKASPAVSAPDAAATTGDAGEVNGATRLRQKSPERSKTARANMEPTRHATGTPGTDTSGAASHIASRSRASGTGLSIAQVGTLAQFIVHTHLDCMQVLTIRRITLPHRWEPSPSSSCTRRQRRAANR